MVFYITTVRFGKSSGTAEFWETLKLKNLPFFMHFNNNCGIFETNSYSPEILEAYLGWYSTLPQYVSENSMEPVDFEETLKFKNLAIFSYIYIF